MFSAVAVAGAAGSRPVTGTASPSPRSRSAVWPSSRRSWSRRSGLRSAPAWRCTEVAARGLTGYQREVAERNADAILDAAEDPLRSQGHVNISAIAVQAGVTVYAHFPTWEALLQSAVPRPARGEPVLARPDVR